MDNGKKRPTWIVIVLMVLTMISVILNVVHLFDSFSIKSIVHFLVFSFAIAAAYLYGFFGYAKDAAKYFRMYCIVCACYNLFVPLVFFALISPVISILHLVGFFVYAAFALVANLGKTLSYVLSIGNLLSAAALLFLVEKPVAGNPDPFSCLILALILLVMVIGKYVDKETRGAV